jgi:hypothetical protein
MLRGRMCAVAAALVSVTVFPGMAAAATSQVTQQLQDGQGCVTGSSAPVSGTPWPGLSSDLDQAWQLSQGASVTVAVLDTGVADAGVTELAGQVTAGPKITGAADEDCVGHGTFVAGLIAGHANAATGFSGVAPAAHVVSFAVTGKAGGVTADQIAQGINSAVAQGVRIIDVSVATPVPSTGLADAVRKAIAAGVLIVAPAAVDGQTQVAPVYPAALPGVLSVVDVGATGGTAPGTPPVGAKVGLAAPGDGVNGVGVGGGGFTASGASYAAAFVAGTAALVDAYRGPATPADLIGRLESTAVHPGTALPDPTVGYGLVDPTAALSALLPDGGHTRPVISGPASGRLTVPPPPSQSAQRTALLVGAVALGLLVVVLLAMATVTARSRRLARIEVDPPDDPR